VSLLSWTAVTSRPTSFSVQDIVEGAERHQLTDDNEVRRLVAGAENRQHVWMIEDSAKQRQHLRNNND